MRRSAGVAGATTTMRARGVGKPRCSTDPSTLANVLDGAPGGGSGRLVHPIRMTPSRRGLRRSPHPGADREDRTWDCGGITMTHDGPALPDAREARLDRRRLLDRGRPGRARLQGRRQGAARARDLRPQGSRRQRGRQDPGEEAQRPRQDEDRARRATRWRRSTRRSSGSATGTTSRSSTATT